MKRILLPLLLLVLGVGGGVGAGLALAPAPAPGEAEGALAELADPCGAIPPADPADPRAEAAPADSAEDDGEAVSDHDYVRFKNQFIVPVVVGGEVASLVLLSLSVEVPLGQEDAVLMIEPKLRDVFLQVLFDHANTGGFEGTFTAAEAMRSLRASLKAAARDAIGDLVTDVLILDLVRQDR